MQPRATGIKKKDEYGYEHNNEWKEGIDFLEEKKFQFEEEKNQCVPHFTGEV